MTDTATLNARKAQLEKAMASGVLSVRHGETQTTFRSYAEMERALAEVNRQLADNAGTAKPRTLRGYQSGKGL